MKYGSVGGGTREGAGVAAAMTDADRRKAWTPLIEAVAAAPGEEHRTVGDFGTQKRLERALGAPLVDWRKESSGQPVHGSTVSRTVTRREPQNRENGL